jgi:hypothetical protein
MFKLKTIEWEIFRRVLNNKSILRLIKKYYKAKSINYGVNNYIEYQLIGKANNRLELLKNIKVLLNLLRVNASNELFILPEGVL